MVHLLVPQHIPGDVLQTSLGGGAAAMVKAGPPGPGKEFSPAAALVESAYSSNCLRSWA